MEPLAPPVWAESAMSPLGLGYTFEVDSLDSGRWYESMLQFDDASFYQTVAFGAVRSGESRLSHVLLKKDGVVVAMALARLARIPGLPIGIAYIGSGPMWQRTGQPTDIEHLQMMLRALRLEYAVNRGYFLRVVPNLMETPANAPVKSLFLDEGFSHRESPGETVVLDLTPPLEELRRNLGRKWRQTLQSAEKRGLGILEGSGEEYCRVALDIFHEMKGRKGFFGGSQSEALDVHRRLPPALRLHLAVCTDAGEPIAVMGWSSVGTTGVPLVSATRAKALEFDASYLLWWRMIEYYKARGFSALDVGGANKQRNPGGYSFKTRILGKGFKGLTRKLGEFDACTSFASQGLFEMIYAIRSGYRKMGYRLASWKGRRPASDATGNDTAAGTIQGNDSASRSTGT
jgi:lipid II:glycine glycyltransferase (peptidoglycan interpeptide bridge formation enzyme)